MFRIKTFFIGIILTALFTIFYLFYQKSMELRNYFNIFELKTVDLRYRIRGERPGDFEVAIIGIDERSLNEVGRWPWKRTVHGELVEKLNKLGVKSIAFDVSFTEPAISEDIIEYRANLKKLVLNNYREKKIEKEAALKLAQAINELDISEDVEFAKSIRDAGNVSIGTYNIQDSNSEIPKYISENQSYIRNMYANTVGLIDQIYEVQRMGTRSFNPFSVYKIIPPLEIFSKFSYGVGPYEMRQDDDGLFRKIPLVTLEEKTELYFPPVYFLAYLDARGYTMDENVVLNVGEPSIQIYEDAGKLENLILNIPTNVDGYQYLNFYGGSYTFEYFSFVDILNEKIDRKNLEDKIVLVGYTDTAKGLYDLRPMPFDANYPGVELHATGVQNLIDKEFMHRVPIGKNLLIVFFYGILITIILSIKKMKFVTTNVVVILLLAIYYLISQLLFGIGIWIELFYPLVSFFGIYISLTVINYFGEEIEKKKVKNAFSHYTNPALIEQLMAKPDMLKLGGEKRILTVFFSDIAGFTTISESMGPEELVEFLNEYLSIMTDIILDCDGMVDKYEGDAIMAVFGAPIWMEDNAIKCCYAAIEYQERLAELRQKWKKEGLPEIRARIGVNTGDMLVGNMGSQTRFDYTVIGDEVNLAARLEGANKMYGTETMISEKTYVKLNDDFITRELDVIRVKGKKKPVKVYELITTKDKLDETMSEVIKNYSKGVDNYREKNWDTAIEYFKKALAFDGEDTPSKLYIERCENYKKANPGEDWDGVYTFTTK